MLLLCNIIMNTKITRQITLNLNKCPLCGHEWENRVSKPIQCPRCKRADWNKEKSK